MECFSAIRKNGIILFARKIDATRDQHNEQTRSQKADVSRRELMGGGGGLGGVARYGGVCSKYIMYFHENGLIWP